MNVYIRQNELQNAYIWEYVEVWTYSYDFRNKTTSQLSSDWWTNTSGLTTGANWVTSSGWRAIDNTISWLWDVMANAKKLRIEMLTYNSWWGDQTAGVLLLKDGDGYTQTWFYLNINSYEALCWYVSVVSGSLSNYTWEVTIIGEFDFVNKTFYFKLPNIYENTVSLTDSWIAIAKATNGVRCPLCANRYLESFSITIE
jgi:hypothetical protein